MKVLPALLLVTATACAHGGEVTRVAFGSCAHQDRPQPIWDAIGATAPERFLFIGDNVYADTTDPAVMKAAYAKLAAEPHYRRFAAAVPVLPVWDDHDYGANDAGADFAMRAESEQIFLDFYGVPTDDPRRQREGVYHAEVFGPPGRRVQVILLDVRYFKSPWSPRPQGEHPVYGRWAPTDDVSKTILGEAQWAWLEQQLREPAEVRLIASGIQVVSEEHGWEKWANFPHERQRLFDLIRDTEAAGVVLLSGDRHKGEISEMDAGVGYPLYDVTSSGLNQGFKGWFHFEPNRHRVAEHRWGNVFGLIEIHWAHDDPKIDLEIRFEDGEIAVQHRIRLSTLQPGALPEIPPDH